MPDTCAVVKIKDDGAPGGFIIINESDFDPKQHKKYEEKSKADAKAEAKEEKDAKK